MPAHLKALLVVLVLATIVLIPARRTIAAIGSPRQYRSRIGLWYGSTLIAFVLHTAWLYFGAVGAWLLTIGSRERNKFALFLFLLFVLPPFPTEVPGFGLVNYLFHIDQIRFLALVILLPAFFGLQRGAQRFRFGTMLPDKLLLAYLLWTLALLMVRTTFTDSLRQAFYLFIDIFLPYYVASRSLRDEKDFRDAALSLVIAAAVLGAIAVFELLRSWLLYVPLIGAFETRWHLAGYLLREGNVRAIGSTGQAIVLGYVLAVAWGMFLYLRESGTSRKGLLPLGLLLAGGLVASLSRGPWVGAAAMLVLFLAVGPSAAKRLGRLAAIGIVALPLLLISPVGNKVVSYLPFVGTVDASTVTYRERLVEASLKVIRENPIAGKPNAVQSDELTAINEGGVVDLVNTWLGIALNQGVVGLLLFLALFGTAMLGIYRARRIPALSPEERVLGAALFATLAGIQVIIVTVSSISFIPVLYWSFAGMGVAYLRMAKLRRAEAAERRQP
ncbi:MAG TPA: O-antigen ligase family protein [Rhodocyclaceae bacterium]